MAGLTGCMANKLAVFVAAAPEEEDEAAVPYGDGPTSEGTAEVCTEIISRLVDVSASAITAAKSLVRGGGVSLSASVSDTCVADRGRLARAAATDEDAEEDAEEAVPAAEEVVEGVLGTIGVLKPHSKMFEKAMRALDATRPRGMGARRHTASTHGSRRAASIVQTATAS